MSEINVVSLFDGMSCLQMALGEIGVVPNKYYASEVDKYAIKSTMHLFPNTIQLGDVRNIKGSDLGFVHLIGGGSPCQSFSFAGKRKGMSTKCDTEILTLEHYLKLKEEDYEFEGQSYLFWEYMRILNELREINPNIYFLLENVEMGGKWEKVLSRAIGANGIHINSALVSAQNRKRIYWTNIGMEPVGLFGDMSSTIKQPKDKKILLKHILESEVDEKYYLSEKAISFVLDETRLKKKYTQNGSKSDKSLPHLAKNQINWCGDFIVHNMMPRSSKSGKGGTGHLTRDDGKTYTGNTNAVEIKSKSKDNLVMQLNPSKESNGQQPFQQNRVYDTDGISPALMAQMSCGSHAISHDKLIRRLTPRECGKLQTIPEHLLEKMLLSGISDTRLYRMFGNGWTVSVISHILSYLPKGFMIN